MLAQLWSALKTWLSTALSEVAKKPGGLAAFLVTMLVATDLAFLILLINRYLAVFGQPGLIGFGNVAPLLPTLAPLLALCTLGLLGLIALYVGAPMLVRHLFSGSPDHPLAAAYAWPNDKDSPLAPAAIAYLAAHGPMFSVTAYIVAACFLPDRVPVSGWLFIGFVLAGLAVPLGLVVFKAINRPNSFWKTLGITLTFSFLLSCFSAVWIIMVLALTGVLHIDPAATSREWRLAQAAGVVIVVIAIHLTMTVLSNHRGGMVFAFLMIVLTALTWVPGDQLITFNALRITGVGGGVVNFYRNPKAADLETLKAACLVLATGDLRIVWLVDDADRCSGGAMLRDFQVLRAGSPKIRQAKLQGLRVLKSELFIDQFPIPTPAIAAKP
jgi:hypothetical protein